MTFLLPDGLPAGCFRSWGSGTVWVSDELPSDLAELWCGLYGRQAATGLLPVLCRPDSFGRRLDLAEVDAVQLEARFAADFAEYRRVRLPWWTRPAVADVPKGVEPFPHDPGPPFESWPGLAPPSPAAVDSSTAAAAALPLLLDEWQELRDCRLVLVPADRSADLPAVLGWAADVPLPLLSALLRSWEERFGAQVVALYVVAGRPPQGDEQAERLALEHVLSTAASIVDDPPTLFPVYATGLVGRTAWRFWWD